MLLDKYMVLKIFQMSFFSVLWATQVQVTSLYCGISRNRRDRYLKTWPNKTKTTCMDRYYTREVRKCSLQTRQIYKLMFHLLPHLLFGRFPADQAIGGPIIYLTWDGFKMITYRGGKRRSDQCKAPDSRNSGQTRQCWSNMCLNVFFVYFSPHFQTYYINFTG